MSRFPSEWEQRAEFDSRWGVGAWDKRKREHAMKERASERRIRNGFRNPERRCDSDRRKEPDPLHPNIHAAPSPAPIALAVDDDHEVLFALQMSLEHDQRHQALALQTWMPCIKGWLERAEELQRALDRALDSEMDKLLAMPDERIQASLRLEGHDPKDVATIAKQAAKIAMLTVDLQAAEQRVRELEKVLATLRGWDMVHEPALGVSEPCADAPWARRLIDAVLPAAPAMDIPAEGEK